VVDLDQIDRTLARLRETVAVMSSNLVDLESDAVRMRLDQASLTGTTAARWSEAKVALGLLWQWFSQLNDVLERAGRVRGSKGRVDPERVSELSALLSTPSIELSTSDIPLAERGLLGARQTTTRCTPDELLSHMTAAFGRVTDVVGSAGRAWAANDARLQSLDAELSETDRLAASLGTQHGAELDRLRGRLGQLGAALASDPLGADGAAFDPVDVSLGSLRQDIGALTTLRDGMTARMAEARTLLDELHRTVQAGAEAHRQTLEKIAAPGVPSPLPDQPDLDRELNRTAEAGGRGDWRTVSRLLSDWTARATASLAEAHRVLDANRAPVAARNELRGRLDAYRAKAFRLGLLENPTVAGLYERAHRMLYCSPTDLASAAELVGRYQHAIAELAHSEVSREM